VSADVWYVSKSGGAPRWVALLLSLMLAGCATGPARKPPPRLLLTMGNEPPVSGESVGESVQGYNVPGRNPNSEMPWEFFLGHAAHRLIAYMYKVKYPRSKAFFNTKTLLEIVRQENLGDPSRLLSHERNLRPDITDTTPLFVFEIKPWDNKGLEEGRQKVQIYLAALNRAGAPETIFSGGTGFQGEILIRFAQGQYIWRLEWQTPEPGVTQYRWTRSQQRFESEAAAYDAGQWVELTQEEMLKYGGWVAQAVDGMVERREQLAAFSAVVGIFIDIIGHGAVGVFSSAMGDRMGPRQPSAGPPNSRGGQVIPFPSRPPPTAPPAQVPAAAGK
jgi:hypothetical protein